MYVVSRSVFLIFFWRGREGQWKSYVVSWLCDFFSFFLYADNRRRVCCATGWGGAGSWSVSGRCQEPRRYLEGVDAGLACAAGIPLLSFSLPFSLSLSRALFRELMQACCTCSRHSFTLSLSLPRVCACSPSRSLARSLSHSEQATQAAYAYSNSMFLPVWASSSMRIACSKHMPPSVWDLKLQVYEALSY